MGKKSVIALAVVAAGYLGTTWFLGQQAENAYHQTIDEINQQLSGIAGMPPEVQFKVTIKEYKRGFFSSDALFEISANVGGDKGAFEYKEHIEHGPLPAAGVMRGEFMPVLARAQGELVKNEAITEWFDLVAQQGNVPVNTVTYIGFNTKGRSQITFSPIDVADQKRIIKLSPAHFTVDYNLLDRNFTADGALPSLVVNDPISGTNAFNLTVDNIKVSAQAVAYGLPNGHSISDMQIDKIQVGDKFLLSNLTADSTEKVIDGISNIVGNYNIESIKVQDYDFGSLKSSFKVSRFNRLAIEKLQHLYMRGASPQTSEAMNIAGELLTPKPEFELDSLQWKNSKGQTTTSLMVQLSMIDLSKVEGSAAGIALGLVPHASYKLDFSRDMLADLLQFVEKTTGQSAQERLAVFDVVTSVLNEEKVITLKDNRVLVDFALDNGAVTLNGVQMTLKEFIDKMQNMAGLTANVSQPADGAEPAEGMEDWEDWEGYDDPEDHPEPAAPVQPIQ